jgi:serine/threonine protein kinase
VKVLDFGLAKAFVGDGLTPQLSGLPTVTVGSTGEGLIVGTPTFMSPEQARGQAGDKRTDIWAFGCVLYQMLTGRLAFSGETVPDTIAAVLEREPDWSALPSLTPPHVLRLLRRCLEKDPKKRARDIGDIAAELEDVSTRHRRLMHGPAASRARQVGVAITMLVNIEHASLAPFCSRAAPSRACRNRVPV